MSKNKHGAAVTIVVHNGNVDGALRKLSKISSDIMSDYRRTLDHYEKPSSVRHQKHQALLHKLELERQGRLGLYKKSTKKRKR